MMLKGARVPILGKQDQRLSDITELSYQIIKYIDRWGMNDFTIVIKEIMKHLGATK